MPSPHPPQAQGAWVCLPCGLKRAIPGTKQRWLVTLAVGIESPNHLIDLSPPSPAQYLSCSGVSANLHGR